MTHRNTLVLGVEGGGTRTVALWTTIGGELRRRAEFGPGNARLLSDNQLSRLLRNIARHTKGVAAVGLGFAGVRTAQDRGRLRRIAAKVWPGIPCFCGNDLETALTAATLTPARAALPRVLVLSGTGSCCYGIAPLGQSIKVGGWGHLLGDRGSSFEIGLRALNRVVEALDHSGHWPSLGRRLLRALQMNEPEQLIDWIQSADKAAIAALAQDVLSAASESDALATSVAASAATRLAHDAVACAQRLTHDHLLSTASLSHPTLATKSGPPVLFLLTGGALTHGSYYEKAVRQEINRIWPHAAFLRLQRESAWGAVALAQKVWRERAGQIPPAAASCAIPIARPEASAVKPSDDLPNDLQADLRHLAASPTEQRNPASMNLDRLPLARAVELMLAEEAKGADAVRAERRKIVRVIQLIVRGFRRGGRLFYVGAGTSGRLGVLDASECPPTFRSPPNQVQGVIAGGQRALWQSVEGAEDDTEAGANAMIYRGVARRDVVVGITASGRTPFVWGALLEAQRRKAATVLLAFNPNLRIPRRERPTVVITPRVGPEVLTGSTRLKAGTATKIILNMLTTLAMAKTGKVIGNLMVDLNPLNAKLRDRAVRVLGELTGLETALARRALEQSHWNVKDAWRKARSRKKSRKP